MFERAPKALKEIKMNWNSKGIKSAIKAVGEAFYDFLVWIYKSVLAILTAATDAVASAWRKFKTNSFRLMVYGESLMTLKTRESLRNFSIILSAQYVVDFIAWSRIGAYTFPREMYGAFVYFLATVVSGIVFATAILILDITIITHDMSKKLGSYWPLAGRGAVLVAVSFVTAVPLELTLYAPTIWDRLVDRQKVAADTLRKNAIKAEEAIFDTKIASALKDLVKISEGYTLLQGNLEKYRKERAVQRKQQEQQRADGAKPLQDAINKQRKRMSDEQVGHKVFEVTGDTKTQITSGKSGTGYRTRFLQEDLDKMEENLRQYDAATTQILKDFDVVTKAGETEREAALNQKSVTDEGAGKQYLAGLRAEKDKKILSLRTTPPEQLSQMYGGVYKTTFDFITRMDELFLLAKENPRVRMVSWGIRGALIALGLFILLLKLFSSEEFVRYFSFGAQAANGERADVVHQAEVAGFRDAQARKALGHSIKCRDLLLALGAVQRELAEAYARWCQQLQTLASEISDKTHLNYHLEVLRSLAHELWVSQEQGDSVMECILELEKAEEKCRLNGLALPSWPDELGDDPRQWLAPWNISEDDAILYGWSDPKPALLLQQASKLADARHKLVQAYIYFRSIMMYWCQERNPKGAPAKILPLFYVALAEQWRVYVMPAILYLEKVEQECRSAGMAMPCWPAELGSDPRTLDQSWQPPPDELAKLGWEDPTPATAEISKAKAEVFRLRELMESRVAHLNFDIAQWVIQNLGKTASDCFKECGSARLDSWRNEITLYMVKLAAAMRVLSETGEEVPPWNPDFNPGPNGWLITEELLSRCGWVKPLPATQAKEHFHSLCVAMKRIVDELNLRLAAFIRNNPGMSADDIRANLEPERLEAWETVIVPSWNELADEGHKIVSAGEPAPSWAPDFNPEVLGWQLDTDLLIRFGWTKPPPAELPVPEPEPAADPPPSAPPADDTDPSNTGT